MNDNILFFGKNIKINSNYFNQIGKIIDSESGEYYWIEYLDGYQELLCLSEKEIKLINIVDIKNKQCYNELTDSECKFIGRLK